MLHVDETGSTNDDLLDAALAGDVPPRTALVTAHQTAGRGRLDRRWDAPPGSNLLVTLSVEAAATAPTQLMQRVGLAIVDGLETLVGAEVPGLGLKWPNDVMLDDRKLAGVLAQARLGSDGLVVVVGFGMNVAWAPDGAACVRAAVSGLRDLDRAVLLAAILASFDRTATDIGQRYRARLVTLGQRVRVELPGGRMCEGRATDVHDDGRLEVVDDLGVPHRFDVGDVVHLRPATG